MTVILPITIVPSIFTRTFVYPPLIPLTTNDCFNTSSTLAIDISSIATDVIFSPPLITQITSSFSLAVGVAVFPGLVVVLGFGVAVYSGTIVVFGANLF